MDQQQGGLDLHLLLTTIVNGKWIILAVTLLAGTLAIVSNYFQALKYQASAQIQIDTPPFLPAPGQDLTSQSGYYSNVDRYFKTQREKLISRRIRLGFAEELRRRDPSCKHRTAESIAAEFDDGFIVQPVEDTNLISIFLISDSPEKAAKWLNLYADVFVEDNARLQEENVKQSRELLRAQLDEIKNLLASQQGQMSQYAGNTGSSVTADGGGEAEFLFRYQSAYDEARRKRLEEEQKLKSLEGCLAAGTDLADVPNLDFSTSLRTYIERLAEARAALEKLRLDGKGEEHPLVVAKRADANNLQEQIRAELKKNVDSLKLNISVLKSTEDTALNNYKERLAQRNTSSKKAQEVTRMSRVLETWTNASTLVEEKLRSLKVLESFVSNNISVVERAQPDSNPVSRRGRAFILLISLGGMLVGSALVVVGEVLNPKIKTVEEIQSTLSIPALGFLPKGTDFSLHEIREAYNVLRTEILFRRDTQQHRSLMVTSSIPQEGKTTVTLNLGKTLASAGDRTIVVDFDLRKARLRALLSSGNQDGSGVFSPIEDLKLRIETTDTRYLHLLVPAALPPNPPFLLSQPEIKDLIQQLREHYDWVLVDTPPVTSVTDAVIVASLVDTVLFVVKHNFVDKRIVRNSLAALTKVNANIMGAILNDVDVKKMSCYSYQSYHRYHSES